MSWIVEYLILHRMEIKSKLVEEADGYHIEEDFPSPIENLDLESDVYNDLLIVEREVKNLHEKGVLSDSDIDLLNRFSWNPSLSSLEKDLGLLRQTISSRFKVICNIISLHLGGLYTNKGYLNYMKEKYNLNEDQMNILSDYIKSNLKHKIIRKGSSK